MQPTCGSPGEKACMGRSAASAGERPLSLAKREVVVTEWRVSGRIRALAPQIASRLATQLPDAFQLRFDALVPEEIEACLASGRRVVLVIRGIEDDIEEVTRWSCRALARRDIRPSDLIVAVVDIRAADVEAITRRVVDLPRWPHLWIAS